MAYEPKELVHGFPWETYNDLEIPRLSYTEGLEEFDAFYDVPPESRQVGYAHVRSIDSAQAFPNLTSLSVARGTEEDKTDGLPEHQHSHVSGADEGGFNDALSEIIDKSVPPLPNRNLTTSSPEEATVYSEFPQPSVTDPKPPDQSVTASAHTRSFLSQRSHRVYSPVPSDESDDDADKKSTRNSPAPPSSGNKSIMQAEMQREDDESLMDIQASPLPLRKSLPILTAKHVSALGAHDVEMQSSDKTAQDDPQVDLNTAGATHALALRELSDAQPVQELPLPQLSRRDSRRGSTLRPGQRSEPKASALLERLRGLSASRRHPMTTEGHDRHRSLPVNSLAMAGGKRGREVDSKSSPHKPSGVSSCSPERPPTKKKKLTGTAVNELKETEADWTESIPPTEEPTTAEASAPHSNADMDGAQGTQNKPKNAMVIVSRAETLASSDAFQTYNGNDDTDSSLTDFTEHSSPSSDTFETVEHQLNEADKSDLPKEDTTAENTATKAKGKRAGHGDSDQANNAGTDSTPKSKKPATKKLNRKKSTSSTSTPAKNPITRPHRGVTTMSMELKGLIGNRVVKGVKKMSASPRKTRGQQKKAEEEAQPNPGAAAKRRHNGGK